MSKHNQPIRCVDIVRWLRLNVPADALTVAEIDIERGEFEVIPYLLQHGDTLRLIDEIYIECHAESWKQYGHSYRECLDMYKQLRTAGVFVHEWV